MWAGPAMQMQAIPPYFRFFDTASLLEPPPAVSHPISIPLNFTSFDASEQLRQRCAVRALAHATASSSSKPEVPIVVFGASVSAGCGAEEVPHRCAPRWSWARRAAELFQNGGLNASVHVWAKGAVDPSFFVPCLRSRFGMDKLSRGGIVLLEFEPIYSALSPSDPPSGLLELVARVRADAPLALVALVGWPDIRTAKNYKRLSPSRLTHGDLVYTAAARDLKVDVLLASPALPTEAVGSFYADAVHPSPNGHALLATLVHQYVLRLLEHRPSTGTAAATTSSTGADGMRCEDGRAPGSAPPPPSTDANSATDANSSAAPFAPSCFPTADTIPIAGGVSGLANGWALRDEARAGTGHVKLGLVSRVEDGP